MSEPTKAVSLDSQPTFMFQVPVAEKVSARQLDTGGEFCVVCLFMGKTAYPARVRRKRRSGEERERRSAGGASEFATSVTSFDGHLWL